MSNAIVIGAGPAGLTAAYELSKNGVGSTLLEADRQVGGLSRTVNYRGYRFDIGNRQFAAYAKEPRHNKSERTAMPNCYAVELDPVECGCNYHRGQKRPAAERRHRPALLEQCRTNSHYDRGR